jgi:hypothetical protein
MKKKCIVIATGLAVTMLAIVLATSDLAYAQIESNGDTQDSSGDETITESNSFTNEPTQTANVECNAEGATCTVTQESESNGGGPVTHGPISTSRSNIRALRTN